MSNASTSPKSSLSAVHDAPGRGAQRSTVAGHGPQQSSRTRRIVRVCLPVSLSSGIGLATTVVLTALIGQMGGSALYIRSIYAPLSFVLNAVTVGAAVPLQVRTARTVRDAGAAERGAWLGSSARIVIVCGLVVGLLCAGLVRPLAWANNMPASYVPELRHFLILMVVAVTINAIGELCAAMVRGSGATTAGTLMSVSGACVNVAFVALVGLGAGAGLFAVPCGYVLGGAIEITIGAGLLVHRELCTLGTVARWDSAVTGYIVRIGLPVAASFILLFIENSLLLHIVSGHGRATVEGFSAGMTIQTLVIVPAAGFASGLAILMNQTGDLRGQEAQQLYRRGVQLLVAYYAFLTVLLIVGAHSVAEVMIGDHRSADQMYLFLHIVGPSLGLTGLALGTMTILEETGFGHIAVVLNLLYFVEVIVIGWLLTHFTGSVVGLYAMMTIAGGLAGLVAPRYVRHIIESRDPR